MICSLAADFVTMVRLFRRWTWATMSFQAICRVTFKTALFISKEQKWEVQESVEGHCSRELPPPEP